MLNVFLQIRSLLSKERNVYKIGISYYYFFLFLLHVGNKYLKQLCVKGNRYDPGNNDSLAEMLTSNNTLTDLDLGTCDLRGKSALKTAPQNPSSNLSPSRPIIWLRSLSTVIPGQYLAQRTAVILGQNMAQITAVIIGQNSPQKTAVILDQKLSINLLVILAFTVLRSTVHCKATKHAKGLSEHTFL